MFLCIDTDTVLEAFFTGLNARAGDLMSVLVHYNSTTTSTSATRLADRMHIALHSDHILQNCR